MTHLPRPLLCCLLALASSAHATNLTISLRSEAGLFVVAEGGGGRELRANRAARGPWEAFTLFDLNGGRLRHRDRVVLRAVDGHFVAAEGSGGRELNANRDFAVSWETFTIERTDGSTTTDIDEGSEIRLRAANGQLVGAQSGELRANDAGLLRFRVGVIGRFPKMKLSAPFAQPFKFGGPVGFDRDRAARLLITACNGFFGANFPNCYDQHEGTDFMLHGWFPGMDLGVNEVITAQGGVVLSVADGNADHCFAAPNPGGEYQIQCPGNPNLDANRVELLQDDGDIASYWHLKLGSVTVRPGQRVECGQLLGLVGSSGISSAPHLHFQLNRDGVNVDPYTLGAWASLSKRIPQRTCNVPPPEPQICTELRPVFNCSSDPARSICQGVEVISGGCVVPNVFGGGCAVTCAQACGTVNQAFTIPCP